MGRLYKFVASITVLIFGLAGGILSYRVFVQPNVWLSTSSPANTYTVKLTGDKGRGGFIFYSTVNFNVLRNGQTIVKNAHAHSGDFMDISFELAYPEHAWVDENVIRFWKPESPEGKADTILVSNNSGKVIRYLKINARDMFLTFDLEPKSSLKLSASHQSYGNWIATEGEFIDGQRISWTGVNFVHRNGLNEPFHYCVIVNDAWLKIESPQAEGYDGNGSSDVPNIPKSADCNPLSPMRKSWTKYTAKDFRRVSE